MMGWRISGKGLLWGRFWDNVVLWVLGGCGESRMGLLWIGYGQYQQAAATPAEFCAYTYKFLAYFSVMQGKFINSIQRETMDTDV